LGRGFRLHLGFPLDAGGVLCRSFLLDIPGGQTISRVGGLAEQLVEAGCPATTFNISGEAGLRLLLMPRWPGVACSDGGLVLTLESTDCYSKVGFELLPPSGHGQRVASWFGLLLFGWLLGKSAAFQLGLGFGGRLPYAAGGSRPLLVAVVDGFELLAFGGNLAGERLRVRGLGVVVLGGGVGGLLPGVGFGLGGEPELAGHLRWGGDVGALGVQDAGFELAASQAAHEVGFVTDFQGTDGGLPHVFEFGAAPVRARRDDVLGVGDTGGFAVSRGGGSPPGVLLAQRWRRAGSQDAEVAGEPGFGQLVAEGAGPCVEGSGEFVGDSGGSGGCALGPGQVVACELGQGQTLQAAVQQLAMDWAPSIGAAVIWSMSAEMSCPVSWAARSRWCRAWREGSR
jgi:hypothetical protein